MEEGYARARFPGTRKVKKKQDFGVAQWSFLVDTQQKQGV